MNKNLRLKIALIKKGISQREMACMLGVDPAMVSFWVNGWKTPPVEIREKIAEILEMPVEELFDNSEKEKTKEDK